jgi:hypothetical protein
LVAALPLVADADAGPGRTALQSYGWGALYYEAQGRWERTQAGFLVVTGADQVSITGSEFGGLRLRWEREELRIDPLNGSRGVEVRIGSRVWNLRLWWGRLTLTLTDPEDTIDYERNGNRFTITGSLGTVTSESEPSRVTVRSPLGTTTLTLKGGTWRAEGPPLERIPYLGRGLFIPFHGAGVFLDLTRYFPMPELVLWQEWQPLNLGQP